MKGRTYLVFAHNSSEVWSVSQFQDTDSLGLVDLHTPHYGLFDLARQLRLEFVFRNGNGQTLLEFRFCPACRVGSLSMQKLINEHPEGPYIRLRAIDVVDEALRRHVDGRADIDIFELFPN